MYGSKNLNSYPYTETTKTVNGITFTDNGDGTVFVGDLTQSQTASANVGFSCHVRIPSYANGCILKNGNYVLSGCPTGGDANSYCLELVISNKGTGNEKSLAIDVGNGKAFTIDGCYFSDDYAYIGLVIHIKNPRFCLFSKAMSH